MFAVVVRWFESEAVVTYDIQVRPEDMLVSVHEHMDEAVRARDAWNEGEKRAEKKGRKKAPQTLRF